MKFSIILPVRNGGNYVKECVGSILAQTFTDFNLLILENKSTDGTLEWLQSIDDSRVYIFPSDKPLSIEQNWARILNLPKNEFITLIGHDDILYKDYLEIMERLISKFPDASLYQTHFTYINAKGEKIRNCKRMAETESAENFLERFLKKEIDVMGTGFMMRAIDYNAIGGISSYPNLLFADFELWINLTKMSYKATSGEECFSFRLHQSTTTKSPDTKFHQAFERFIYFLNILKVESDRFKLIILENANEFLTFYCRSLSHRLLRTPKINRNKLSVKQFVEKCRTYAEMLGIGNIFKPNRIISIRLAILFDSNAFGRTIFLGFKKIFTKPILK